MVKIFIDDERECPEGFLYARTFEKAKEILLVNKGNIKFATFDNDLNQGFDKCGMHLFPFMQENEIFPPKINCHTGSFPYIMAEVAEDYMPKTTKITAIQFPPYEVKIDTSDFKDRLCDIFNIMRIDRPFYSSSVEPMKLEEGGSFYYSEMGMGKSRTVCIGSGEGFALDVQMPHIGFELEYGAVLWDLEPYGRVVETSQIITEDFDEACEEYGYEKTSNLLTRVEKKIAEHLQPEEVKSAAGKKMLKILHKK